MHLDPTSPNFVVVLGAIIPFILAAFVLRSQLKSWTKLTAIGLVLLYAPYHWFGLQEQLSKPKSVQLEFVHRHAKTANLVGATMKEGVAIWVWLQLPGEVEPRAYRLPWSRELAQQLQGAQQAGQKNGQGIEMRAPFEESLERREPVFHARPQEALPEKSVPSDNPLQLSPSPNQSSPPR